VARQITAILFDWDGTLLDSAQLGLHAFQGVFRDLGIPFHEEWYNALYSPNWYSMYEALQVPRERWALADELWMRHYGEEPPALVAGARATLCELRARGYTLGVVTSGSEARVKRELSTLGLSGFFTVVVCNESTTMKKPHPEALEIAMRSIGAAPEACSYAGDSPEDVEMGKRAGVHTVGVRSSYPGSTRLASACPDLQVENLAEVLAHFPRLR
jgi:HAD superfamily hydrolase (TIGR01509 family)